MENIIINEKEKEKDFIKPQDLSLNDSESNEIISLKLRAKTYENNSPIKISKERNKGFLQINSPYIKQNINLNSPKSTKKHNKKEIIYKYKNHSYFKDTLGSIPTKSEKILLENQSDIKDRFKSNDPTINKIKDNTPGVGSYNLEYDWNLKNNGIYMDLPEEKRFKDDNLNINNYYPCVGHYDAYKGEKYEKEKNNLRYDSLYIRTRVLFNDELKTRKTQDKGFIYNPKNLTEVFNNKKKFNFGSYSSRDNYRGSKIPNLFGKINNNPGPNYYFNEFDFELRNRNSPKISQSNQSTNTDLKLTKELNLFSKKNENLIFSGKNKEDIDKPNFIMKQNGHSRDNKVYNLEDIFKMKTKKIVIKDDKKELDKKIKENEKNVTSKKLYYSMEQDRELEKIKKILGNDNGRPDFFYLSPDRWKKNKNNFKAPGPAYYFYRSNII